MRVEYKPLSTIRMLIWYGVLLSRLVIDDSVPINIRSGSCVDERLEILPSKKNTSPNDYALQSAVRRQRRGKFRREPVR